MSERRWRRREEEEEGGGSAVFRLPIQTTLHPRICLQNITRDAKPSKIKYRFLNSSLPLSDKSLKLAHKYLNIPKGEQKLKVELSRTYKLDMCGNRHDARASYGYRTRERDDMGFVPS